MIRIVLTFLVLLAPFSAGMNVLSIDWGSRNIKIAGYSQREGHAQIILSEESSRLIPNAIALYENRVHFGARAEAMRTRHPDAVFSDLLRITGNTFPVNEEDHQQFRSMISGTGLRNAMFIESLQRPESFVFAGVQNLYSNPDVPLNTTISPLELTALQLGYLRELAEDAGYPVERFFISVPPFTTDLQKRLIQQAAEMINTPVDIMYDTQSLTSEYGVQLIRGDALYLDCPERYVLLIDSGASATRVNLVEYAMRADNSGEAERDWHGTNLASGWTFNAAGATFDYVLAIAMFQELDEDQRKEISNKNFEKLLAEARRVKEVLSANVETEFLIQDLLPNFDFKKTVTRAAFNDLIDAKAAEVTDLIKHVIAESQRSHPDIKAENIEVQLVGGNSRVPLLQEKVRLAFENTEAKINTNMNSDEAVVEGAFFVMPVSYHNFVVSPNALAVRVAQSEEPGIYLQGSAEFPQRLYGIAITVDEELAANKELTLELFYYAPSQWRLLATPQSPRLLQIEIDLDGQTHDGPWSVIVQIALPFDFGREYLKIEQSDSSFDKRIVPISRLDDLLNLKDVPYTTNYLGGGVAPPEELDEAKILIEKINERERGMRKQEKIESDLEGLINEGVEVLGSYSERSRYFHSGEKEQIEQQVQASQKFMKAAEESEAVPAYEEWEEQYNTLRIAIDKPMKRYLTATGQLPKEVSRRHKTTDTEKRERLYPDSKVTFQEKLQGVFIIVAAIAIGVFGYPLAKQALKGKKSGHKLGGRTLKALQEQIKNQKQNSKKDE